MFLFDSVIHVTEKYLLTESFFMHLADIHLLIRTIADMKSVDTVIISVKWYLLQP